MSSGNEGYKNWRLLLKENAEPFSNSLSSTLSTLRNNLYRYPSITDPEYSYNGPVYRPEYENKTKYGDSSLGTSTYDPEYLNVEESGNWLDLRALNQPWYSKAFNGIMKGGVLAGTTFVSGIAGLLYGGVEAIAKGDLSKIWDNDVTLAMNDINQYSEYYLPNYYTKEEQESPWYTNILSANFVFDKFVKNLGFTVGAAVSGGVFAKGVSYAARGIGALRGLGVGAEALGAESKLGGMTKGLEALWSGEGAGQSYELASKLALLGMKAMELSRGTRATKALVGTFFNAVAEGTVEAVHNSTNWADAKYTELDQLALQESMKAAFEYENNKQSDSPMDPAFIQYIEKLSDIEKRHEAAKQLVEIDRKRFGTMDLTMNIPILWAGDWMTFSKFYKGGWRAARNISRTLTRATKEALKEAKQALKNGDKEAMTRLSAIVAKAEATGYQGLTAEEKLLVLEVSKRNLILKVWPYLKEPLKEGNEEMAQAAAELTSGYYYNKDVDRIFAAENDPESVSAVLDFVDSLGQGIKDSYGDINRWEEGFIGALTGLLGVPTFGSRANSSDLTWLGRGKPVGITGGVVTAVRNSWGDRDNVRGAVQHVNEVLHNPDRIANFKHLVALTRFEKDQAIYASQDDEMQYKNSKTAALFEDVMYFKKVGRLDLLKRALENTELLTEEDIDKIVEKTTSYIDAQGATINTRAHIDVAKENLDKVKATLERAISLMDEAQKPEAERSPDFDPTKVPSEAELDVLRQNYAQAEADYQTAQQTAEHVNGTIFNPYMRNGELMSAEEIREDITKRAAQVWQMIEDITKIQDEIDSSSGEVYGDKELATLTWYKAMSRDWERRASALGYSLKDFIKAGVQQKEEVYSTMKQIKEQLEKLRKENDENGKNDVLISVYDNLLNGLAPYNYGTAALNIFKDIEEAIETVSVAEAHNFSNVAERKKLSREERLQAKEEQIENAKKRQAGIRIANLLSSDLKIKVPVKKANSDKDETEEVEMTIGEFLMTQIRGAIAMTIDDADIQAITLKNLEDLKRIGEAYKEYQDKIIEFRKNPRGVEEKRRGFFNKIKDTAGKVLKNGRAEAIKKKLNFKEGDGMLLKSLRAAFPAILNFGGLNKLKAVKGLFTKEELDMLTKAAKSDKIINSTIEKLSNIDVNGLELLPEATASAVDSLLDSYPNLGPDNLNDLYNQAVEKATGTFDLLELDVDVDALQTLMLNKYNDAVSEVVDAFIKADLDDREESSTPTDPGLSDAAAPETVIAASRKISDELWENTPDDDLSMPVDKSLLSGGGRKTKTIEEVEKKAKKQASESTSNIKIALMKRAALNRTDATMYNDADPHQALSEFLLGGFVDINLIKLYLDHPELIPEDILDKEGFKQYVNAVWEYLYGSQSGNFASLNIKKLQPNETLVFFLNPELSAKAGVNVVVITRQSTGEVVGSLMSQHEIDAYETYKARGNKANPAIEDSLLIYRQLLADPNTPLTRTVKNVFSGDLSRGPLELTIAQAMNNGSNSELLIGVVRPSESGAPTLYYYQHDPSTKLMEKRSLYIPNALLGQVYWLVLGPSGVVPVLTYSVPLSSVIGTIDFREWARIALFGEDGHFNNPGQGKLFKFLYLPSTYVLYTRKDESTGKYKATVKDSATHISVRMLDMSDSENPRTTFRLIKLDTPDGKKTEAALTLEVLKALTSSYKELYGEEELAGLTVSVDAERLRDTTTKVNDKTYAEFISHTLKSNVSSSTTVNDRFTWNAKTVTNPMDNNTGGATKAWNSIVVSGTNYRYSISPRTGEISVTLDVGGKQALVTKSNPLYVNILEAIEKAEQQNQSGASLSEQQPVSGPKTSTPPPRVRSTGTSDVDNYTKDRDLSESTIEGEVQEVQAEEIFLDELSVLREMFPHLDEADRVTIVESLRSMSKLGVSGDKVYGKFKKGMILIALTTIKGSLYHESFHYAMDALLTEKERQAVYEAVKQLYPTLLSDDFSSEEEYVMALEEKGAEKFRMFMLGLRDKTFRGKLLKIFRKLKYLIQQLFGNTNYLDSLFYRMYSKQLANRPEYSRQDADYYGRQLESYYSNKYDYDNLSQEEIEYMIQRGISREAFDLLSNREKEVLLKCM